jgi:hypothetical protein
MEVGWQSRLVGILLCWDETAVFLPSHIFLSSLQIAPKAHPNASWTLLASVALGAVWGRAWEGRWDPYPPRPTNMRDKTSVDKVATRKPMVRSRGWDSSNRDVSTCVGPPNEPVPLRGFRDFG